MTEIEVRAPYEQHPQREAVKGMDLLFAEIGTSVLKSVTDENLRVVPLAAMRCGVVQLRVGMSR
jgi:hypothetical protein